MKKIIGLVGYANSGKTTLSKWFQKDMINECNGVDVLGFSKPIYKMLNAFGVEQKFIDDKELREQPHPALEGKTPIEAMISLGTFWGREKIGKNIWVNRTKQMIIDSSAEFVIIENIRFQNEFDMVTSLEYEDTFVRIVGVEDEELKPNLDRASEKHVSDLMDQADYIFNNDKTDPNGRGKFSGLLNYTVWKYNERLEK